MAQRPAELDRIFQKYLPNSPHFEKSDKFGLKRKQMKNQEKNDHFISPLYRRIINSPQRPRPEKCFQRDRHQLDEVTIIIDDDDDDDSDKSEEIIICEVSSLEDTLTTPRFKCLLCSAVFARKQDHISHHLKDHVSNICDEIYMAGSAEILFM